MSALVVCAFPGSGKSVFYQSYSVYEGHVNGIRILDSDSSEFSWVLDENGNKTNQRNPKFPLNYIKHIKDNIDKQDIIFVSSHELVRNALHDANIKYINIYPKDNITNMKEWRNRFIQRGNSQSFIDIVMTNWSNWIKDMENDIFAMRKVSLDAYKGYPFINKELIKSLPRMR
jgi:hypothetical protein